MAIIVLGAGLIGGIVIALPYASAADGMVGAIRVSYVLRDVVIFAIAVHLAIALRWTWSVAALLGGLLGFVTYDALCRFARAQTERPGGATIDLGLIAFFASWPTHKPKQRFHRSLNAASGGSFRHRCGTPYRSSRARWPNRRAAQRRPSTPALFPRRRPIPRIPWLAGVGGH